MSDPPFEKAAARGARPAAARDDRSSRRWLGRYVAVALWFLVAGLGPMAVAVATPADFPGAISEEQQRRMLAQIDAVGRRGFLFEVMRPSADATSGKRLFLYGTIHLGRIGSEPFNVPLLKALRASRRLALEADPTDSAGSEALALQLGRYADGDGLQRHVSAELMARVAAFGRRNGLPAERVDRFRPWLLANMIALTEMNGAGLDTSLGSELYLSGFARARHMPIVEVEGMEAQLHLLAGLPDALQTAQLEEALGDLDDPSSQAQGKALFDLWLAGDVEGGNALVDEMHRDAGDKVFERYFVDQLIDARNRTMADKAESYLERAGDTFFAVGSLHLFGAAGLIREFERRGCRVVDLQGPPATAR